jgi:hypothetical protein
MNSTSVYTLAECSIMKYIVATAVVNKYCRYTEHLYTYIHHTTVRKSNAFMTCTYFSDTSEKNLLSVLLGSVNVTSLRTFNKYILNCFSVKDCNLAMDKISYLSAVDPETSCSLILYSRVRIPLQSQTRGVGGLLQL